MKNFVTHFDFGDSRNSYCFNYCNRWNIGGNYGLKFNSPTSERVYVRLMKLLKRGPATRREINSIMGWQVTALENRATRASNRFCNLLAQMRYAQLIDYDTKTRQWSLGKNAANYMKMYPEAF